MQVTFDPTDYTVNENAGTVTLMVRKIGQSAIPVMVNITTSSGSAVGMYTIELPYASSSPPSPPHFTSPTLPFHLPPPLSLILLCHLLPSHPPPPPPPHSHLLSCVPSRSHTTSFHRWNGFHWNSTTNLDLPCWWR